MPRPAVPSHPSVTSQVPGFFLHAWEMMEINPRLHRLSDAFVSYTNNPKMQTQEGEDHLGTVRKVIFARQKGMIIMIY